MPLACRGPPSTARSSSCDELDYVGTQVWQSTPIVRSENTISCGYPSGRGKIALRYAQLLALATGRPPTGEHVFQRCRVLIVSLEDDVSELRRRILAARLHYNIDLAELKGWLFLAAPGAAGGKADDERQPGQADSRKPCRQAGKRHHGTGNRHHQSRPVRKVAFGRGEFE